MSKILILLGDKPVEESEGYASYAGMQSIDQENEYSVAYYREIIFSLDENGVSILANEIELSSYDLIYIRDFHGYEAERNTIADYCKHNDITFVNKDIGVSQKISKLAQYAAFSFHGVAFPKSVCASTTLLQAAAEARLSYPMVVKAIIAKSGNDNFLVQTPDELRSLLADHKDTKFIAQEAVPNEGDYRVIVLGDSVGTVYLRTAKQGDHRNNVSQGGGKRYLTKEEVPDGVNDIAIRAAKALDRDICGVDVMINANTGGLVVLEGNFNFGIRAVSGMVSEELYGLSQYLSRRAKGNE